MSVAALVSCASSGSDPATSDVSANTPSPSRSDDALSTLPPVTTEVDDEPPSDAALPDELLLPAPATALIAFDSPTTPVPAVATPEQVAAELRVVDVDLSRASSPSISDDGRLAFATPEQLCVIDVDAVDVESCVPIDRQLDGSSLAWAPDGRSVAGSDELLFDDEPDITLVDLAAGVATVVSGDDRDVDADLAPFFDAAGVLRFARLVRTEDGIATAIASFEDGVVSVGDPVAGFVPLHSPAVGGGVAAAAAGGSLGEGIGVIDLASGASVMLLAPEQGVFSYRRVVDIAAGRLLLVSPDGMTIGIRAGLYDLATGRTASLNPEVGDRQQLTGIALDPTGTRVAAIVEDRADPLGHQLLIADIGADGAVGSFEIIATGDEFAPNEGDTTIRPRGFGIEMEMIWIDGFLRYALGPLSIVSFPIE